MQYLRLLTLAFVTTLSLCGCGGGSDSAPPATPPPPAATFTATGGVAQKGPLILGSTVTAQELTANLAPTGKQYSYQTNSDFGTFNPNSTFTSQYLGVSATGYYFDEASGALSSGPITLNAYVDLSGTAVVNVNLLTTLAYQRIQKLVANSGMTFAAAQSQAEAEVLAALGIRNPGSHGHFTALDISKDTDGDNILAAISSLFSQGNTAANLTALIANIQNDIGNNGQITSASTNATLRASAQNLRAGDIAANLNQRYASAGVTFTASDISDWIDQDGDDLTGRFEFQVTGASQSSAFTIPAFVTSPYVGTSISVSDGRLSVNGTVVVGPVQLQAGDVVAVLPPASTFPSGVVSSYLRSGTTKIARVAFISGLQSIAVTPANPTRAVGLTQQFTASGTFTDGSVVDLTASASWTSSTPAVASINGTGSAVAHAVGTTTITAISGLISGATTLNVVAATLQSISIAPDPAQIGVGVVRQFTATAHYSDGGTGDLTSAATWSTGNPALATVTGGLVTGVAVGTTTVSAGSGTISGSAALSITSSVWTAAAPMDRSRAEHTATVLSNGKVFVAFGYTGVGGGGIASCSIYDPLTDKWSAAQNFSLGIAGHRATLLPDGRVLITGGNANGPLLSSEIYDPVANSWAGPVPMALNRGGLTATALQNGKVLVVGGHGTSTTATTELFDPVTNTWSSAASMSTPRSGHVATLLPDGRVLVAGGSNGAAGLASAEIYDPAANSWSPTGAMTSTRVGSAAALLANGKVLVAGGTSLSTAEIYDSASNSWSAAASMGAARSGATATVLPSGRVLVVSGQVSANRLPSSAEIYDPVANTWMPTPALLAYHLSHTATLLPSGAVLIVGGETSTTELYW